MWSYSLFTLFNALGIASGDIASTLILCGDVDSNDRGCKGSDS